MPWPCCGAQLLDDVVECPRCGKEKPEWTTRFKKTRVFSLSLRYWVEVALRDHDDRPVPGERYKVVLPSGEVREGRLDDEGRVRIETTRKGTCLVSFPDRDRTCFAPTPPRPREAERRWVAARLLDEHGVPVKDEPFVVSPPDAIDIEGVTDEHGCVFVDGLTASHVVIRFPRRDVTHFVASPPRPPEAPAFDGWLEVCLVDAQGAPLAGDRFVVVDAEGKEHEGTLDGEGRARVDGLPPGECTVRFPDRDPTDFVGAPALAPPPEPEPMAWAALALVDDRGQPLAGERFVLVDAHGREHAGTLDEHGHARVDGLPPGPCTVRFPDRDPTDFVGAAVEAQATSGPPPPRAWVELHLLDDRGQPLADEPFVLVDAEGVERQGVLDASGRARLDDLAPGPCTVRFPARDGSDFGGFTPPPVDAGGHEPPTVWVEFSAYDERGQPLGDEPFVVIDASGNLREGRLDAGGRGRVFGLAPGPCTVRFPQRDPSAFVTAG